MPRFVTSPEEHSIRYNQWKGFVENMSDFVRPDSLTNDMSEKELESNNKYTRFMSYTREWISAVVTASYGGATRSLRSSEYDFLDVNDTTPDEKWFSKIMKVKDGEELGFDFPRLYSKKESVCAYDAFMPAYRALKESFEKRSIWQWFTNHAQYTAERDAIKALEGTMIALTRGTKADIKTAYEEYCSQLPNYEPDTISNLTKEFESQPMFRVPVSSSLVNKYKSICNQGDFDRNLRNQIFEVIKDIDSSRNGLAFRMADSYAHTRMPGVCGRIDEVTPEGPEAVDREFKRLVGRIFTTSFSLLAGAGANFKDAVIKAQKITDITFKSGVPSLCKDGQYADLANNYVISNKEVLNSLVMGVSTFTNIENKEALLEEIYNELNNVKEPEPAPAPETKKVEQIDSAKERLDLSADLGENKEVEKSPEIKETSAPVVAQEKVN